MKPFFSPNISNLGRLVRGIGGVGLLIGWQNRLAGLIKETNPEVEVVIYKYGYFNVLAFLIPFFRPMVVHRFRNYLIRKTE